MNRKKKQKEKDQRKSTVNSYRHRDTSIYTHRNLTKRKGQKS